jgi:hypothetical protein
LGGIGLCPIRETARAHCHSAWSKAQAQNPSMPFSFWVVSLREARCRLVAIQELGCRGRVVPSPLAGEGRVRGRCF